MTARFVSALSWYARLVSARFAPFVGSGCAERDGRRIECGASLPTARTHMEGTDTYSMCPWQRAWQVEDVAWPYVNDDLLLETVKVSMRVGGPSNSACATCNT